MSTGRLFEPTLEGKRRRVLFALGLTTALVNLVAATSTFIVAPANMPTVVTLGVLGLLFVAFSFAIVSGQFSGLFRDEQLFWEIFELQR